MNLTTRELELIRDLLIDESEMNSYPESRDEVELNHFVHNLIDTVKSEITKTR